MPPPPLKDKEWRSFSVEDIFDHIQRGRRLKTADHIEGDKPYVSSTAINNGVDNFIGNVDNVRTFKDCLTVANSGSVGAAFYHPYEFVASDHVTAFGSARLDRYGYLFVATLMSRLTEKYSFNREINDVRVRREKILLPTTANGSPDFDFMSAYVRSRAAEILSRYFARHQRK